MHLFFYYDQVFIRDFIPSALAFLLDGGEIVKNFLFHTLQLQSLEKTVDSHRPGQGLMPASFKVRSVALDGNPVNLRMFWILILVNQRLVVLHPFIPEKMNRRTPYGDATVNSYAASQSHVSAQGMQQHAHTPQFPFRHSSGIQF
ncbi:unnamed protein product [Lactuca virosa]|uniref:Uncharacterized protein n=1 Tax=Lactuca virosa TaxID=75947 RepID=A0AAU9NQU3_9ASTR|nr:unnamed protein product [Lactuca virosa]